jgi:sirohydrochlorin cobaltochelatase
MSGALILFAHGARDPRWAEPLGRIQQLVAARVAPGLQVHQAFLELMSPSLTELIARLALQQINDITVVPVFLGQGGHVRNDLPQLINELQSLYSQIQFTLTPAIGEDPRVLDAIANACIQHL